MPTNGRAANHFDYLENGEDDPTAVPPEDPDLDEHETGPDEPLGPHQGETEDDHHSPDEEGADVAD